MWIEWMLLIEWLYAHDIFIQSYASDSSAKHQIVFVDDWQSNIVVSIKFQRSYISFTVLFCKPSPPAFSFYYILDILTKIWPFKSNGNGEYCRKTGRNSFFRIFHFQKFLISKNLKIYQILKNIEFQRIIPNSENVLEHFEFRKNLKKSFFPFSSLSILFQGHILLLSFRYLAKDKILSYLFFF